MDIIPEMSREDDRKIKCEIEKSSPSDRIHLSFSQSEKLRSLAYSFSQNTEYDGKIGYDSLPSDIFFAGTIPLMDCEIIADYRDILGPTARVSKYRVVIFENYREVADSTEEREAYAPVGAFIEYGLYGATKIFPIGVKAGENYATFVGGVGYYGNYQYIGIDFMELYGTFFLCMGTWYGIQLALLHPKVKEVFQHPTTEIIKTAKAKKGKQKRRVKYIKNHIVKDEELTITLSDTNATRDIQRKTLAWYVIGHWRKQKGKHVFVRPYWKGPLRDIKRNFDEREREIIVQRG